MKGLVEFSVVARMWEVEEVMLRMKAMLVGWVWEVFYSISEEFFFFQIWVGA